MSVIKQLYGIYHANGGIIGELSYIIGKYRGTTHCALCDITHGTISMKNKWKELSRGLNVPFNLVHLNERIDDIISISENNTPCIIAETEDSFHMLISSEELEKCNKSVDNFGIILNEKIRLRHN
jgi:hypothetical protein|tara:strand:+ start:61 stop:435 length:375 start_codon:yes stop_codon:yes gene_type:complete